MVSQRPSHRKVDSAALARMIRAMLLVVDIGNTSVTIGLVRSGSLVASRRAVTHAHGTADELELQLDGLLRLDDVGFADISAIACASVVPTQTPALETPAQRRPRPPLL